MIKLARISIIFNPYPASYHDVGTPNVFSPVHQQVCSQLLGRANDALSSCKRAAARLPRKQDILYPGSEEELPALICSVG